MDPAVQLIFHLDRGKLFVKFVSGTANLSSFARARDESVEHNDDAPKIDSNLDFAGAPAGDPLDETTKRATGRSRDGNHADPSWIVNVRLSSCRASRLRLPSKVQTSADYPVEILNGAKGERAKWA